VLVDYFASDWYSTLFTNRFAYNTVIRIWDIFLIDGLDYLYAIAMAVIQLSEAELLTMNFEKILAHMKDFGKTYETQEIISKAEQTRKFVTRSLLKEFESEFVLHPPALVPST